MSCMWYDYDQGTCHVGLGRRYQVGVQLVVRLNKRVHVCM